MSKPLGVADFTSAAAGTATQVDKMRRVMCLMPSSPAETNAQLLIFLTEVKWDFRGSVSVQNRLYRLVHLGDGRHAVDPADEAPGPIMGEERRGLGAIFGESRSVERRVGKEGGSRCRSRWWAYH